MEKVNFMEKLLDGVDLPAGRQGVEWKPLGDVVNIKNGKDWKKLATGDIPVYGFGGVMEYVDTSYFRL